MTKTRDQRAWVIIVGLVMVTSVSCFASAHRQQLVKSEGPSVPPAPSLPWAWNSGNGFVSRGVSKIERAGSRYLLTMYCGGVYSIYAQGGAGVSLDESLGGFVQVRFTYASVNPHIRCVRAPCGSVTEQVAHITQIEPISVSVAEVLSYQQTCTAKGRR